MKIYFFLLLVIIMLGITNTYSLDKNDLSKAEKFIKLFFDYSKRKEFNNCYKMFTENFKEFYKKENGMSYIEYHNDDSYNAETRTFNYKIIKTIVTNNYLIFKSEYYTESIDAPGLKKHQLYDLKVIKTNDQFMIDNIEYQIITNATDSNEP